MSEIPARNATHSASLHRYAKHLRAGCRRAIRSREYRCFCTGLIRECHTVSKWSTTRKRITDPKRDALNLFTFLEVNGMPPTNNHAEQALRLPVIFRKISFGSRSLLGAQSLATNLSLITTAKRQNRKPIDLLKTIILRGSDTPLANLYDPDNIPPIDSS